MTQPTVSPDGAWEWNPQTQSWQPRSNATSGAGAPGEAQQPAQATPAWAPRAQRPAGGGTGGAAVLLVVGIVLGVILWLVRLLAIVMLDTKHSEGWWTSATLSYALAFVGAIGLVCAVLGAVMARGRTRFLVVFGLIVAATAFGDYFSGVLYALGSHVLS
jgi:hypothetical protein